MYRYFFGTLLAAAIITLVGCSGSVKKVHGVVKLDGNPVEGATVSFVSEDGAEVYTGFTDSKGVFSLFKGQKEGIPSGSYKVTVVKTPKVEGIGSEGMAPGGADYFKQMEKERNDGKEGFKKGGPPMSMPGKGGPMMGPPGGGPGKKSDLPGIYAAVQSTPITVKIPADADPIPIDLKSKP